MNVQPARLAEGHVYRIMCKGDHTPGVLRGGEFYEGTYTIQRSPNSERGGFCLTNSYGNPGWYYTERFTVVEYIGPSTIPGMYIEPLSACV